MKGIWNFITFSKKAFSTSKKQLKNNNFWRGHSNLISKLKERNFCSNKNFNGVWCILGPYYILYIVIMLPLVRCHKLFYQYF